MFFSKFLWAIKRAVGSPGKQDLHGLHSSSALKQILKRERARTDRTAEGFSFLVFSSPARDGNGFVLGRLARILKRRLRSTDEAGWMEPGQIGVVLPATPPRGAWKLADDLGSRMKSDRAALACEVYYYPSDVTPDQTSPGGGVQIPSDQKPIYPMETLFVQGLPVWKRCLDVTGAVIGMIVLAPLYSAVAMAVRLCSPGPILFKQYRSGLGGKPFAMYKFRTMVVGAEDQKCHLLDRNEQDGPAFKITEDPRLTAIGKLLRKTSIDELPQLWNVLRGEMSLVGPRPLPCDETEECDVWHRRRLDVTPGLTCIWQVQGRPRIKFADWMRTDIRYAGSRTVWRDLKLLFWTIPAVILCRGS
jgi:lipopolysaccharide/colanic/teichoic acid biosynthesis glycosyltransferase